MPKLRKDKRKRRRSKNKFGHPYMRKGPRNLSEFVPKSDSDFAYTAQNFAYRLTQESAAFGVTAEEAAHCGQTVATYRKALAKLHAARFGGAGSTTLAREKDKARAAAQEIIKALADRIRGDRRVSDDKKALLRIKVRPKKPRRRLCPQSPPRLQFLGSGDGVAGGYGQGGGSGFHVLRFDDYNESVPVHASSQLGKVRCRKPAGAVRVELYFDMVPPGESVPKLPGERGWPKYLRSFTRSPIEVEYPLPMGEPMLIVYWARWAGSTGEVSRWSKPCVARVEGWSAKTALPAGESSQRVETRYVFIEQPIAGELPERLPGDDAAEELAAMIGGGERMLEAMTRKLLESA